MKVNEGAEEIQNPRTQSIFLALNLERRDISQGVCGLWKLTMALGWQQQRNKGLDSPDNLN